MNKYLLVFLVFLLTPFSGSAETYQYRNEQGVITFSDQPVRHYSRNPTSVIVKNVFDGDTFRSDSGMKFRLVGIDAPETPKRGKPGDFYGKEARDELKRLIKDKKVYLKYDKKVKDDYGRFLVFVTTEEGVFVNEHLLEQGFVRFFAIPPNLLKIHEYKDLEAKARTAEQGLWQNFEEREVISSTEAWKFQGKVKFVRGEVTELRKKKKGVELVFDDGKFVAYIYNQNLAYFKPLEEYVGRVITVKGKVKRKVENATTVLFHPIQFY